MTLIIPGVEVTVVKEVVPQQLAPSGVLGIVGLTEAAGNATGRAASWPRFRELFGVGTAYSIPEARQALENGVTEVVVVPVKSTSAAAASWGSGKPFSLRARARGAWGNRVKVRVSTRRAADGTVQSFDLEVQRPGGTEKEVFRQLVMTPGNRQYVVDVLANASISTVVAASRNIEPKVVSATVLKGAGNKLTLLAEEGDPVCSLVAKLDGPELQITISKSSISLTGKKQAADELVSLGPDIELNDASGQSRESYVVQRILPMLQLLQSAKMDAPFTLEFAPSKWPADGELTLTGGADAAPSEYVDALQALENEPDVDLVLAALQESKERSALTTVYNGIIAHANKMAGACKGRLGFGQVLSTGDTKAHTEMASDLVSDRFVLVAPQGVAGAVAGMVGNLPYYYSPTFKRVSGLSGLQVLSVEDETALLKGNVVPVAKEANKGVVVLRGLTTDGDQISVRRVADHAVRGVKMIGDLFIGSLNTENGRGALKQKLAEFLLQMQKDGALVPSTDNSDPAFKVNVYSSQNDFALGIVRVDIAVRPVRAIDYIYATILVQT